MKRFIYIFLTITLCFSTIFNTSATVFAETDSNASTLDAETDPDNTPEGWPVYPTINGEAAILIEASTGTVLYEKSSHKKMYPASITKILTGILAIENCDLSETVTISENAVSLESNAANINCKAGEELSVEDCLYALLLASANEIATALAEHIAGSVDAFADMMNDWATEAGATDSHFANANGLHNDDHYITAYDMAMITKRAIQNPVFCAITGTCEYTIAPTNKTEESRELNHRHKMVWSSEYSSVAYDGVIGGKTGYTTEAGTTLVTYAERDGMTLICVVLNSNSYNVYYDTATLFDYGFDNFNILNISENETAFNKSTSGLTSLNPVFTTSVSDFSISDDDYIVLPKTASFDDVELSVSFDNIDSDKLANLEYYYAGSLVGTASILPADSNAAAASAISNSSISNTDAAVSASASVSLKDNVKQHMSLIKKIVISIFILVILFIIFILIKRRIATINNARAQKRMRYR